MNIAVVGNGYLSEADIHEINNKYDVIVIFNNSRNNRYESVQLKATHLAIRQHSYGFWGWDFNNKKLEAHPNTVDSVKDILCIIPSDNPNIQLHYSIIDTIKSTYEKKYDIVCDYEYTVLKDKKYLFDNKYYTHTRSPSSGILVINMMLNEYPDKIIHLYGMDCVQQDYHDFKHEKQILKNCNRCVFH